MLVFASWSGPRSRRMADVLKDWLPQVLQHVRVFVSTDIIAGKRWSSEIGAKLQDTKFGLICVTPENQGNAWLNFEAGACSKHMADSHVCPYILQGTPADYHGPLTQFQMVGSDRNGTLQLVAGLNVASPSPLDPLRLEKQFDRCWPELETGLTAIRAEQAEQPVQAKRDADDMVRELLELVRAQAAHPPARAHGLESLDADEEAALAGVILDALRQANLPEHTVRLTRARSGELLASVSGPAGDYSFSVPPTPRGANEAIGRAVASLVSKSRKKRP